MEVIFPPPHLIIAGAGHIGKALAHLGKLLDFYVTVVDDREDYANPAVIPDADQFRVGDYAGVMQSMQITGDTYIVIVTPGHKNDADVLKSCIGSGAAYIGMIGSRNKIELMRRHFISEGWATGLQWDAIHTPVGIDIRSKTVQEIAISIAAQLVMVRNRKT
jgi:xanthine dehydrogenase accessory factor